MRRLVGAALSDDFQQVYDSKSVSTALHGLHKIPRILQVSYQFSDDVREVFGPRPHLVQSRQSATDV